MGKANLVCIVTTRTGVESDLTAIESEQAEIKLFGKTARSYRSPNIHTKNGPCDCVVRSLSCKDLVVHQFVPSLAFDQAMFSTIKVVSRCFPLPSGQSYWPCPGEIIRGVSQAPLVRDELLLVSLITLNIHEVL